MADSSSATALTFHETHFDLVNHASGEPWLRLGQIAPALGYSDPRNLNALYASNATEFTDSMTALVKLPTAGGVQQVRIFSLRGAHLLGMFARTDRAAEFRRWVLDVLENQTPAPAAVQAPQLAGPTFERVVAERDALRAMLVERVLKEEPRLRKVLYYYRIAGLTNKDRAILSGWQTADPYMQALKRLAALGLVDYTPHPALAAAGLRNLSKAVEARRTKKVAHPSRERANRQPPEHMQKMREQSQRVLAERRARKTGGAA